MDENQDVGDREVFEDRIRALFENGTSWRGISASSVIGGARRRRVRHRATAAGASFAVLGVAAAVVTFGAHTPGPSQTAGAGTGAGAVTSASSPATPTDNAAPTTPAPSSTATTPASSSNATTPATSTAETCSASVSGPVPALTHSTADGLDFEAIPGNTAGIPWSVQIHAFPDWPSWLEWRKTATNPPAPSDASHVLGPPALVRPSGKLQYTLTTVPHYSFGFAGDVIGGGVNGSPKVYRVTTWVVPGVDHLCVQFAHHATFEPVYRIQTGYFAALGYTAADMPLRVIGYDAAGHEVAKSEGVDGLLPPDGK